MLGSWVLRLCLGRVLKVPLLASSPQLHLPTLNAHQSHQ